MRGAAADGLFEIRILQNDVRRLAAQLLRHALDGGGRALGHVDAGPRRARERNHVDARMRGHRCANLRPEPVDEVEHARRHARFVQDFGEDQRGCGCVFGGLHDHGAAGGQRGSHFASDLVQRPVPGRNHAGHAHGLAQEHRGAKALLERIGLEHLKRGHQMAETGGRLGALRHGQRRAHFVRYGGGDLLHPALVDLDDAPKQGDATLPARPRRSFRMRAARRQPPCPHPPRRRARLRTDFFGSRVHHRHGFARRQARPTPHRYKI